MGIIITFISFLQTRTKTQKTGRKKKVKMKTWVVCMALICMLALGSVHDVAATETAHPEKAKHHIEEPIGLTGAANEYSRGCSAHHRCRGKEKDSDLSSEGN